jgi:WD40 repeat protein
MSWEEHTARLCDIGPDTLLSERANFARLSSFDCWRSFEGGSGAVTSVAVSPDGKLLAMGSKDSTRLWGIRDKMIQAAFQGHSGPVRSVAFSPDGKLLATGSDDRTARLWRIGQDPQPSPVAELKGHSGWVLSVAFSPDGKLLATGSDDHTARLWRIGQDAQPSTLAEFKGHNGPVRSVTFSPDGKLLATGLHDKTAQIWRIGSDAQPTPLAEFNGNRIRVKSVAFSPDGKLLVTGSEDHAVRLWRIGPGAPPTLLALLSGHTDSVKCMAFSSDGKLLATGSEDHTARLWRIGLDAPPTLLAVLYGSISGVKSIAFSLDGKLLATGSDDHTARLWRINPDAQPTPLAQLNAPAAWVGAVAFSPDGTLLATGSDDHSSPLWRIGPDAQPTPLAQLKGHNYRVSSVAFSPDGKLLAMGSEEKTQLWRIGPNAQLTLLQALNRATSVAFSPDGTLLATGSEYHTAQLWRIGPDAWPTHIAELTGHTGAVTSVAFSPYEMLLATGSDDGRVFFWGGNNLIGQLWSLGEGWVSQRGDRIMRHDPGGVLLNQDEAGRLLMVPPPKPAVEPKLSLELLSDLLSAHDGGADSRFVVRVRNAMGAGRAYWLHLSGVELPEGVAIRTERTHLRLEPGEFTDIPIRVSVLTGKMDRHGRPDDEQPIPQPRQVPITLMLSHAFGDGPSLRTTLEWRAPKLTADFKLIEDGASAIEARVRNDGNQDPSRITVEAVFVDAQNREVPVDGQIQFDIGSLAPGKSVTFSLPVPDELRVRLRYFAQPLRVKLRIRDGLWYTHLWQPQSEPLRSLAFVWSLAALVALVSLVGIGLRLYLDPVVRATTRDARAMRRFPLPALPRVSAALARVRRLDSALDAAGLKRAQWDRAQHAADSPRAAAQALADVLGGTLGAEVEPGCPAFAITMPPLALRFAQHAVVCVVTGRELEPGRAATLARQIHQEGRGSAAVLLIDLTDRKNAKEALHDAPHLALVALSSDTFRDLLLSDAPLRVLEEALVAQRPVVTLSPYVGGGAVTTASMFFGRAAELRQIADERPHNVLLVGPRQMGKSTLLHALERRIRARGDLDVQHHTLVSDDLLTFLASKMGRPRPTTEAELYELLAGETLRPRMWLLDEADGLVRADRELGYMLSRTLRALADDGRAFFVLAGFWQLYAAVALDPNSALRNFGRTLRLGPLDRDAARDLATKPMAALRLTYDTHATVEYLLDQTGCRANLVSVACSGLIESLDPTARSLTREHVEAVLRRDKGVRDALSFWRGSGGTDGQRTDGLPAWARALDRALLRTALLCLADGQRPSRSDLRSRLDAAGLRPTGDAFQQSLDRVELSYLLIPDDHDRYFCPIPLIQRTIEREQPLAEGLAEDVEDYGDAVKAAAGTT